MYKRLILDMVNIITWNVNNVDNISIREKMSFTTRGYKKKKKEI